MQCSKSVVLRQAALAAVLQVPELFSMLNYFRALVEAAQGLRAAATFRRLALVPQACATSGDDTRMKRPKR
jgi:hypothetical protein